MKKKNCLSWITIAIIIITVILGIINAIKNNDFWTVSFSTCLSIVIAVLVSYFFVQRQTDYRRQKEIFINLLDSLRNIIDDEKAYQFQDVSKEQILMRKRAISNKILLIEKFKDMFGIQDAVSFLEDKNNEYVAVIDGHIDDLETLKKMPNELFRPLSLMSDKIFEIMVILFD